MGLDRGVVSYGYPVTSRRRGVETHLECQSGGLIFLGTGRVVQTVGLAQGELASDRHVSEIGDVLAPDSEAGGIAKVASFVVVRAENAVEVHLLVGVVLVDVFPKPQKKDGRVLHAEDVP